jgi:hypothetical protein
VNCEDDDSLYQQGDKGKQPIGCINLLFWICHAGCDVMIVLETLPLCF